MPRSVDILLVSPGVTAGWRDADRALTENLEALGTTVYTARPDYSVARGLRRGQLMTDLAEASALRRATDRALKQVRPKAFLFSSVQAAMLQPGERLRAAAVRFDAPPSLNRNGFGSSLLHRLERRVLQQVRLQLPYGVEQPNAHRVPLPVPLAPSGETVQRESLAIAYAGNPEKKGLDTIASAWRKAAPQNMRLLVTGIDARAGSDFLRSSSVDLPSSLEWPGMLPDGEFRQLLARAEIYISASRFEDYGQAQLEALAAGCLLVTTPSPGPFEALKLTRELAPGLVDDDLERALTAASGMSDEQRTDYRRRASELLASYSNSELQRRLKREVLPLLTR